MSAFEKEREASPRAVASFVLGLLGLGGLVAPLSALVLGPYSFCCMAVLLPCPVVALVLGWRERHPLASAGRILGWIALGLYALAAALFLFLLLLGGVALVTGRAL